MTLRDLDAGLARHPRGGERDARIGPRRRRFSRLARCNHRNRLVRGRRRLGRLRRSGRRRRCRCGRRRAPRRRGVRGSRSGAGRRLSRRCRLLGGRGGWRARRPRRSRRQKGERVEIAVGIGGRTYTQVDVRTCMLGRARGADRADHRSLVDTRAARHRRRSEVDERDRVAVRRLDRDGKAVRGHRAHERDQACARGSDRLALLAGDVEAAVLPGGVRVAAVSELLQDRPGCRPGPRARGGSENEEDENHESCSQRRQHDDDLRGGASPLSKLVTVLLQRTPVERVRPNAREPADQVGSLPSREAGGDELGDGCDRLVLAPDALFPRSQHERDLSLRRLAKPGCDGRRRAAHDLFELLRQLAADCNVPVRLCVRQQPQAGREAARRLERHRRLRSSSHSAVTALSPRGR
jgi:hypothetical protein